MALGDNIELEVGPGGTLDFGASEPSEPSPTHRQRIEIQTHNLRRWMAFITVAAFVSVNGVVLWGLDLALHFDFVMLAAKTPHYDRFISSSVIMSLLGATTVQLGAIMFAITKFLFPSRIPSA